MSARMPRSLAWRLRVAAMVAIVAALVVAAIAIGFILQRFIVSQVDQRLDTQIAMLASALRVDADGNLVASPALSPPPFDDARSGWFWQAAGPAGVAGSRSLGGARVEIPQLHFDWKRLLLGMTGAGDGPGPDGRPAQWRVSQKVIDNVPVTVAAAAPMEAIRRPLGEALVPLVAAMAVLGALLVAAMWWQVRLGLAPLERLRQAVAGVRSGALAAIPDNQPREVEPLVNEVNKLLADNAEGLSRARCHAANLAHGLKTPLARIDLALASGAPDPAALRDQVALMDRIVRHHLTRARSATLSGPARSRTSLADCIGDLVEIFTSMHRDRGLSFDVTVGPDVMVACERQDIDELFGNLLDNAAKWGRTRISVASHVDGNHVVTTISDDGPGLASDQFPEVLRPGFRIDEATPGYGFGLPIAAELAELYGGGLSLLRAPQGGLQVSVRLPMAR